MQLEWKAVDMLILDLVTDQGVGGRRAGRAFAREEEAWARKRERFDGMMAKERDKVMRRKLMRAVLEVEEEMDSIMEQMFGSSKLKEKEPDLGKLGQNCAADDLNIQGDLQDQVQVGAEQNNCEMPVIQQKGVFDEVRKDVVSEKWQQRKCSRSKGA